MTKMRYVFPHSWYYNLNIYIHWAKNGVYKDNGICRFYLFIMEGNTENKNWILKHLFTYSFIGFQYTN